MCAVKLLRSVICYKPKGWAQYHINNVRILCNKVDPEEQRIAMKILNVAEKNDAAKNLAGYLSGGNLRRVSVK
jgi:ABC-type phosphate/phosphonate transport system ATPase subunit